VIFKNNFRGEMINSLLFPSPALSGSGNKGMISVVLNRLYNTPKVQSKCTKDKWKKKLNGLNLFSGIDVVAVACFSHRSYSCLKKISWCWAKFP
jgi:hypothetical protein